MSSKHISMVGLYGLDGINGAVHRICWIHARDRDTTSIGFFLSQPRKLPDGLISASVVFLLMMWVHIGIFVGFVSLLIMVGPRKNIQSMLQQGKPLQVLVGQQYIITRMVQDSLEKDLCHFLPVLCRHSRHR